MEILWQWNVECRAYHRPFRFELVLRNICQSITKGSKYLTDLDKLLVDRDIPDVEVQSVKAGEPTYSEVKGEQWSTGRTYMTWYDPSFFTFKVCVAEPLRTCVSKSTFQSNAMCSEATSFIFDWVVVSTLVSAIETSNEPRRSV